jgi:hypothetical protein
MEMSLPSDKRTGDLRVLRYDDHGYQLLVGERVVMSRRLEAVCYLVGGRDRETIALLHGLQDAGEFRLARHMASKTLHSYS